MAKRENIFCLIPARGNSKRLPRKNILDFHGAPVLSYAIKAAEDSGLFEKVHVSTEDKEIASVARKFGAAVIDRPATLAGDKVGLVDLCLATLETFEREGTLYDTICLMLPTVILRTKEDILATYAVYQQKKANFAVTATEVPGEFNPYWTFNAEGEYLKPFVDGGLIRKRQDISRFVIANQGVNFAKVAALKAEKLLVGSKCAFHVMPRERAIDIDTQFDFDLAHYLFGRQLDEVQP